MKNKSGFTLIELTVVLAILAIIAAILVPTFLITTDRARLRGDIQTARIIQNAIELYAVERGSLPGDANATLNARIEILYNAGYLPRETISTQTRGASWVWDQTNGVRVDISGNVSAGTERALQNLTDEERELVVE